MKQIEEDIDKLMVIVQNTNPVSEPAQHQRAIVIQAITNHVEAECNKLMDYYEGNK